MLERKVLVTTFTATLETTERETMEEQTTRTGSGETGLLEVSAKHSVLDKGRRGHGQGQYHLKDPRTLHGYQSAFCHTFKKKTYAFTEDGEDSLCGRKFQFHLV